MQVQCLQHCNRRRLQPSRWQQILCPPTALFLEAVVSLPFPRTSPSSFSRLKALHLAAGFPEPLFRTLRRSLLPRSGAPMRVQVTALL